MSGLVGPRDGVVVFAWSERFEEGEEGAGWLVAAWLDAGGCDTVEGALFDVVVGVEVNASGLGAGVVEDERDDSDVGPGAEQLHGARVP